MNLERKVEHAKAILSLIATSGNDTVEAIQAAITEAVEYAAVKLSEEQARRAAAPQDITPT